jgi:WD40 repeat protein
MRILKGVASLACLSLFFTGYGAGQTAPASGCALPPPVFTSSAPNIFNDRQEQDLGDALADYYEPRLHLAPPAANDELTRIGERLLATLPPTGIHYRFRIYDSGEINAFSLAGGRVYISRKLIVAVDNEDSLAGVIAHEIGHLSTHQMAIAITRALRVRLGITQVTDRADIFAKVHQLYTTPPKQYEKDDTEDDREKVADRVALYALVRAGYSPETFASFMSESLRTNNKTGNWLTNIFGRTSEGTQRYRSVLDLIDKLSADCTGRPPASDPAFTAWQQGVRQERLTSAAEGIEGDKPITLDQPLRPSLSRIRFSPDGRFLLAQDESGIGVLDRDAGKVLFRIDAPDVEAAQFTSDSKSVIFSDSKLRVEQWSVADGKRTSVKELVVFDHCHQTLLTPDARTLACAYANVHGDYLRLGVRLIDVESGKPFYENDGFFEPGVFTPYAGKLYRALRGYPAPAIMNMLTSPDGKYLLLVAGNHVLAWDIALRQPVGLAGRLKDLSEARMSFLGPDWLYAIFQAKERGVYVARILTFPDGDLVKETELGNQQVEAVTKGQTLIVHPLKDYAVGLLDPVQGKVLTAAKLSAIDAWDDAVALEDAMGGVAVAKMGTPGSKHIALTLGPLPVPSAAVFSPDGKYLAASLKNRAVIWNLETGKQVKMVRPFSSAWFGEDDDLYGMFPKYLDRDPAALRLSMDPFATEDLAKPEDADVQYRDLQYSFKPMDTKEASERQGILLDRGASGILTLRTGKDLPIARHATLEVKKMKTQAVAWSRDYPDQTPVCWPAEDNRLVLAWDLNSAAAQSEVKRLPALQKEAEARKDKKKGLLIETVVPETGAPLEQVVIPEVDLSRGWFDSRWAMVSGNFVLARGEDRVTAIYRLEDGSRVGQFIGTAMATEASLGLIAAVNREDELMLLDEGSGRELKRFSFASPVRLARFVAGKQKTLLVLTADQVVHRLPLPDATGATAAAAAPAPRP